MEHPIYHLEVAVTTGRVEARLNGFPILTVEDLRGVPATFAPPVNPWLAGERNELELELQPAVRPDGSVTTFDDVHVVGVVKEFEKGDIVGPESGKRIVRVVITDELRKRVEDEELELPITLRDTFATPAIDFSAELREAAPMGDQDALLDYGVRIRDLAAAGNAGALVAEFEGKIQAWTVAYQEPYQAFADSMRNGIGELLAKKPIADFAREDIVPRSCCGGRIWELTVGGERPLLRTPEVGPEKSSRFIRVYVGQHAGELRIVR